MFGWPDSEIDKSIGNDPYVSWHWFVDATTSSCTLASIKYHKAGWSNKSDPYIGSISMIQLNEQDVLGCFTVHLNSLSFEHGRHTSIFFSCDHFNYTKLREGFS